MEFLDRLKGDLPDEELAAIKRYMERRSREAAQVTVTPVSTAQPCIPCSLNPETPSDVYVSMEENDEGRMNPELTELEPPSAGTGLETPGQQCPPNEGIWETGQTIADGYLLVAMGSNQVGDISSPTERVYTRSIRTTTTTSEASNITFLQQGHKRKDKDKGSKENKQFDPGRKEKNPPPWNAAVILFFFPEGSFEPWEARCVFTSCCLSLCACLPVLYLLLLSGDQFSAS